LGEAGDANTYDDRHIGVEDMDGTTLIEPKEA